MELPLGIYDAFVKRGQILHSDNFVDIGHGKFFVIIGVTEDLVVGFFFINSNINRYLYDKPAQMAVQYPMQKADYDFLRYNSFLCANKILKLNKSDIVAGLMDNSVTVVGEMKPEHIKEVLDMVRESDLFKEIEKKRFFYE